MKKIILTTLMLALAVPAISLASNCHSGAEKTAWFDMKNCAFCQHMAKDEKLLDNMTWEHHDISNGIMTITTVKPEYMSSFKEAQAGMMKLANDLETGQCKMSDLKMCNHCQHYGKLMASGAKIEYVKGEAAEVTLMTSDKSETQKMIKDFAERNRVELAKWEAERSHQH